MSTNFLVVGSAATLACKLHEGQKQKDGSPYFAHVAEVAALCAWYGGTPEEIAAAYLHDAIEDAPDKDMREWHEIWISAQCGPKVANIVLACTKPPKADMFGDPVDWEERMHEYANQLNEGPEGTWIVAGSDKLINARRTLRDVEDNGAAIFNKFVSGRKKLWYLRLMADTMVARADQEDNLTLKRIAFELDHTVRKIEVLVD
jgi:(p)ppGpp synthase/HD superfamily hydrolase